VLADWRAQHLLPAGGLASTAVISEPSRLHSPAHIPCWLQSRAGLLQLQAVLAVSGTPLRLHNMPCLRRTDCGLGMPRTIG
jgi:hypothetical protein